MTNECKEYYSRRSSEIVDQFAAWMQSAAVRDESFVRLLRAKIERRTRFADALARTSRDAVAEMWHALLANNERAVAASEGAAIEFRQFLDDLRLADDGGAAAMDALTADNLRLSEVVKLHNDLLSKAVAARKSYDDQLRVEQAVNDRMARNATATACNNSPTGQVGVLLFN